MKQTRVFLVCIIVVSWLSGGCQDQAAVSSKNKNAVDVIIAGGGKFPPELAGKWAEKGPDNHGWEIMIEPNGTISSATITMAQMHVVPGRVNRIPMLMDKETIIEPDVWMLEYDPNGRRLTVVIALKKFHIALGPNSVDGSSKDLFIGSVAEDNESWSVEWYAFPEFYINTKEYKNHKLDVADRGEWQGSLMFSKITDPNHGS